MRIVNCRTDHYIFPLGYSIDSPTFSWTVEDARGSRQAGARIIVAKNMDFNNPVYDSGIREDISSLAFQIPYVCEPYTRYYWQVEVSDETGDSAVSDIQWFETAKMNDPWCADWITDGGLDTENPVFSKVIIVSEDTDARLYICGLGVYEAFLNGEKVGKEYLTPGVTDYNEWIQYQTFELNLHSGENLLEISLGNGWYKGRFGFKGHDKIYGERFCLIAEVRSNGRLITATDDSWMVREGNILFNNIYDGEIYDASFSYAHSSRAVISNSPMGVLTERKSLPLVEKELMPVKEVIYTPAGECVLDFGQNIVGFVRFKCNLPKGEKVYLQYGEVLQDGNFYNKNLRTAKAEYTYISDGRDHIVQPHFTYYGFRYVKVEGISDLNPVDFTGVVVYSDLTLTGSLSTDDPKVNQLISNVLWGQKGNYFDIPTDCPQRDERMGWTGDAQIFSGTACFNMYSYPFLNKFMHDMYMTQLELGYVPHTIPAFDNIEPTTAAWGDAAVIIPWNLYLFYGDKKILKQQYESMKMWIDQIYSEDEANGGRRLWEPYFAYTDWLAMDNEDKEDRYSGGTDMSYISTAYYFYSTKITAKTAGILGKNEDAEYYERLADEIKTAFQKEFFTEGGRLAVPTQTGYVLALFMDLVPEGQKEKTASELRKKLQKNNGYLKTGFVGTPYICRVLSDNGMNDLAYRLLMNEENPSWLYAVDHGATTIWERWNAILEDGTINGTDMTSLNHYAYGSVMEWMYRDMAGLNPCEDKPGFKKAVIAPKPYKWIHKADMEYDSAAGRYEIHWTEKDGLFTLDVTVPFDAEAEIILPYREENKITVCAGKYHFELPVPDKCYSIDSSFYELMEDKNAGALLDEYMTSWRNVPSRFKECSVRSSVIRDTFKVGFHGDLDELDLRLKELNVL